MADLDSAKRFLTENFVWALCRTRRLYVELAPTDEQLKSAGREYGNFEPVLLCICWSDFLGALFLGEGKADAKQRITQWFRSPMRKQNESYRNAAKKIYAAYRNGLVHGYQPEAFYFSYDEPDHHLEMKAGTLWIDVSSLLDDMIAAVEIFAANMTEQPGVSPAAHGSLEAFNKAAKELSINL